MIVKRLRVYSSSADELPPPQIKQWYNKLNSKDKFRNKIALTDSLNDVYYNSWGLNRDYYPAFSYSGDTYHYNLYYHKPSGKWVEFDGDDLSKRVGADPIKENIVIIHKSPEAWAESQRRFFDPTLEEVEEDEERERQERNLKISYNDYKDKLRSDRLYGPKAPSIFSSEDDKRNYTNTVKYNKDHNYGLLGSNRPGVFDIFTSNGRRKFQQMKDVGKLVNSNNIQDQTQLDVLLGIPSFDEYKKMQR